MSYIYHIPLILVSKNLYVNNLVCIKKIYEKLYSSAEQIWKSKQNLLFKVDLFLKGL